MNLNYKQILMYAATFTMVVAAVVVGNIIFYKIVLKEDAESEINKSTNK